MNVFPATMSTLEGWWVFGALFGACFSILAIGFYARAAYAVLVAIRLGIASFDGPRWKYTCGTLVAMLLFLPGWLAFLATGVVASLMPESRDYDSITTVEYVFEFLILGGELCFAAGQVTIVAVWWLVRQAVVFVPFSSAHPRHTASEHVPGETHDPS